MFFISSNKVLEEHNLEQLLKKYPNCLFAGDSGVQTYLSHAQTKAKGKDLIKDIHHLIKTGKVKGDIVLHDFFRGKERRQVLDGWSVPFEIRKINGKQKLYSNGPDHRVSEDDLLIHTF